MRVIKLFLQKLVKRIYFSGDYPRIIVASTGRVGSTMLVECISHAYIDRYYSKSPQLVRRYLTRFVAEFIPSVADVDFFSAPIIKTHDTYNPFVYSNFKTIFVFGDPLESAISTQIMDDQNPGFAEMHIIHLKGSGNAKQLLHEDVLNYEGLLHSWKDAKSALIIDYNDLWCKERVISKFLDLNINLPERRARVKKNLDLPYNQDLFLKLRALYNNFPDLD